MRGGRGGGRGELSVKWIEFLTRHNEVEGGGD